ncbi:MAG: pyruvate kinase [Deltaproteobacteria bacterium]|nr:pyruvate kinase [Deltaproteobacteria bacterium]
MRRAKMVCTIGPASESPEMLDALCAAGMDVARLNFSHGTHEEHLARLNAVRAAGERNRRPIAILQDLCGPKIRAGKMAAGFFMANAGETVDLVEGGTEPIPGVIPIGYEGLAEDVKVGDGILVDDGRVVFRVQRIVPALEGDGIARVRTLVEQGGRVQSKAGVFLPSRHLRIDALTEKDKVDLEFGLSHGVDYVGLSFVRATRDVEMLRDICEAFGRPTPIVAKIETPGAIEDLDGIIRAADAVMVARGDLAVEMAPEQVPVLQKRILAVARRHRRPVIVATEMLQSMTKSTRPTRAEASDVANAIFDGTDAVMLSGETASGDHPAIVAGMMARIIQMAEGSPFFAPPIDRLEIGKTSIAESIARNACDIAEEVKAKLIVCFTHSGDTARLVSKGRPTVPIIAFSPVEQTRRRLALVWGVQPRVLNERATVEEEVINLATAYLIAQGLAVPGERVVLVYGAPLNVKGTTNVVRVHEVR